MKKLVMGLLLGVGIMFVQTLAQEKKDTKPPAAADSAEGPQVGQPAPDFELPWADQTAVHTAKNEWIKLSGQKGSNVILAFYVADWTGG